MIAETRIEIKNQEWRDSILAAENICFFIHLNFMPTATAHFLTLDLLVPQMKILNASDARLEPI